MAVILGDIASPLSKFVFSWHVPLFFILAGSFIKTDLNFTLAIKNKFHNRLLFKYV